MEVVKVYSPIEDKEIRKNLNNSIIWKDAYHAEDLPELRKKHDVIYEYVIKFNGTKPIMVNKISRV